MSKWNALDVAAVYAFGLYKYEWWTLRCVLADFSYTILCLSGVLRICVVISHIISSKR